MIKLQTGISTNMDFIKALKERGVDVNAEFPAETLRDQLDSLDEETKVSFDSTNETILKVVNEGEEPGEDLSIDFDISDETDLFGKVASDLQTNIALSEDDITGTLKYVTGYTGFSGNVDEQSGNYLVLHVDTNSEDDIYVEVVNGVSGPVKLDEDRLIVLRIADKDTQGVKVTVGDLIKEYNLDKLVIEEEPVQVYNVTIDLNGGTYEGETSIIESCDEGTTGYDLNQNMINNILPEETFVAPEGKEFGGLTTVKDDSATIIDSSFIVEEDKALYVLWVDQQ